MDIRYTPRPDTTSEAEVETLRRVYQFVLECYEGRNSDDAAHGGVTTGARHAEESPHEPSPKEGDG